MGSFRKLYVEIANAKDLMPKDGEGCASPYCVLDYDGQRKTTDAKAKELNPVWNTVIDFHVFDPSYMESTILMVSIFTGKSKAPLVKPGFLGRVRIRGTNFAKNVEQAELVYHKLQRRNLFSQVKGEIGIKVWWKDEPPEEAAPPAEAAAEAAPPAPEPAPATPEPAAEPAPATPEAPEAAPAASEPAPSASEAAPAASDPAPSASDPATEPVSAAPEPTPAAAEPTPATTEPAPAPAEPAPENTEPSKEDKENAMLLKPVYWDHNLPYAYEVPWNNFIPSSVLENPYINLPVAWVAR